MKRDFLGHKGWYRSKCDEKNKKSQVIQNIYTMRTTQTHTKKNENKTKEKIKYLEN
jgi:hypothetical protein